MPSCSSDIEIVIIIQYAESHVCVEIMQFQAIIMKGFGHI